MSAEAPTLERQINEERPIGSEVSASLGATVFEALAVKTDEDILQSEENIDTRILNSVTRIPGGQTVPDER